MSRLRRNKVAIAGDISTYVLLLLYGAFMALPLIYSIIQAFKPYNELFIFPPRFFARQPTLGNFTQLFDLTSSTWVPFSRYVFNTVMNTFVGTFLHIIAAAMCAYALAKNNFPGKKFMFNIVVWSLLFSGGVTEIPVYLVMSYLGIIDTYFAYWLPEIAVAMGTFLLKQNMAEIPDAMIEAARIDGAREWTILWKIAMPAVKPAWLTLIIFSFQVLWDMGDTSYIYREDLKPLNYALHQILSGGVTRVGASAAATVLMMIVPILLFLFTQSQIVETLATSGMKD